MSARTLLLSTWGLLIVSSAFADETPVVTPPTEPIATVLGKDIGRDVLVEASTEHFRQRMSPEEFSDWQSKSRDKQLVLAICTPLIKAYAERKGLEPTDVELQPTLAGMAESHRRLKERRPDLAIEEDSPAQTKFRREFVRGTVRGLKVGEALWKQHGGSVGFGSLGSCVAFEGQQVFLKEEIEAGRLVFHDPEIEKQFWRAIMDKRQLADVVLDDPKKIEGFFDSVLRRQTGD